MANVYDNVKVLCEKKNISISALEKKANIANATIRGWNTSSPRLETLQKVAEALGVPVSKLIN